MSEREKGTEIYRVFRAEADRNPDPEKKREWNEELKKM
jgi:hypothetical protein